MRSRAEREDAATMASRDLPPRDGSAQANLLGRSLHDDLPRCSSKWARTPSEHRNQIARLGAQPIDLTSVSGIGRPLVGAQRRPSSLRAIVGEDRVLRRSSWLTHCGSPPPAVTHITAAVANLPGGFLGSRTPAPRADFDQLRRFRIHDSAAVKSSNPRQIAATRTRTSTVLRSNTRCEPLPPRLRSLAATAPLQPRGFGQCRSASKTSCSSVASGPTPAQAASSAARASWRLKPSWTNA